MKSDGPHTQPLSALRAVLIGHLVVNVPAMAIFGVFAGVGLASKSAHWLVLVGIVPAWIFWSFAVPRWRRWALAHGAPAERTQQIAAATGLTWPKGSVLEKTEARLRDGRPRR